MLSELIRSSSSSVTREGNHRSREGIDHADEEQTGRITSDLWEASTKYYAARRQRFQLNTSCCPFTALILYIESVFSATNSIIDYGVDSGDIKNSIHEEASPLFFR